MALSLIVIVLAVLAFVVVVSFVAAIVVFMLKRTPPAAPQEKPDVAIRVSSLQEEGPSAAGPQLECYGVRVRLAALVIAPVGRANTIPETEALLNVVDQLVPGLVDVVSVDQPVVRFWAPQLSSQGFVNAFFHQVSLPGDRGKGTPWCSVAGKFSTAGQQFMIGFVFRAAEPNGLSAIAIQHDGQWNDVLRIRR